MCTLNQIKKKLQLKKLIDFLTINPYLIFYHSNSGNRLRYCPIIAEGDKQGGKILFLVNSGCVRQLAASPEAPRRQKIFNSLTTLSPLVNPSAISSSPEAKSNTKQGRGKNSKGMITFDTERIRSASVTLPTALTFAAAMGSTFLVGCKTLEEMQKVLMECKQPDYICLGGIYDKSYVDHRDCQRLAQLDKGPADLLRTITFIPSIFSNKMLLPQNELARLLKVYL